MKVNIFCENMVLFLTLTCRYWHGTVAYIYQSTHLLIFVHLYYPGAIRYA
jgi:hypothetical protein